jgi:N-acetyl-gamma-glutamyl-phosphate reductase
MHDRGHSVAILGPTGYTGLELIEILAAHPTLCVTYLASARENAPRIDAEFPRLAGVLPAPVAQCRPIDHDAIAGQCALAFLCLPPEAAMVHAPQLLARGVKVVDLSAAYRLKDPHAYQAAYGHAHTDAPGLARAVYGLPELFREQVRAAQLVANPGCYPTAAALALAPLLRAGLIAPTGIIVNAASGASGAGREAKPHLTLVEAGDNFSAYGIGVHRHQPEIIQTLHLTHTQLGSPAGSGVPPLLFVPHLLPVERGILETIYARPTSAAASTTRMKEVFRGAYEREPLIVVRDDAPTLRDVQKTCRVHINARVVGGHAVIVAAIDNLVKGASGQAVQNANLMLGLPELAGLGPGGGS